MNGPPPGLRRLAVVVGGPNRRTATSNGRPAARETPACVAGVEFGVWASRMSHAIVSPWRWASIRASVVSRIVNMRLSNLPNTVKQMKALLVFLIVLVMAPTPSVADFFRNSDQAILDAGGTVSEVAPNWRIVCLGEGRDLSGRVTTHRHCRMEKSDFRALAVITSEGLSIPYLPSRPICGSYPSKMRVDGKRIGKLPLKAKIAAMSRGITFARPYQTQWPECQVITEFTGLYGFSAALSRLKVQWRKFR